MKQTLIFKQKVLALVLTVMALAVGQSAWAQTFTIQPTYNSSTHKTTFTITRSGSSLPRQTINYRTVNLSAYAGQHYTAVNDTYTFPANETTTTVEVEEKTASADDAYKFQNGATRRYRFEVLDVNGFELAHNDCSITIGTSVPGSGLFNEKEITIYTDEAEYSDAGYDKSPNPHYINSSSYYTLSGIAPKAYYTFIGAELRSTLSFDAREIANGYQYVQILINNTSGCDNRKDCSDGDPGNISLSRYMAGFDHDPGSKNTTYAAYTFPVTSQPNNNTNPVDNAWNNGVTNKLYKQKFNTGCRATDGRLILPLNFTSLVVRFNASGGGLNDNDEWLAKNVKAHIQAVDATKPTLLNSSTDGITVSAGPYNRGNTFYISVPFSEIVTISGSTKKLSTEWGDAFYESGSGTNVLTFKGTINKLADTTLKINGLTGTVSDLSGNNFSGSISKTFSGTTSADPAYSITYDLAGGTLTTANPSTYRYTTSSFTLNNPTKAGYIFDGWTGSNGTTPSKTVTIANHSHGNKSYTANWSVPYIDADGNEQICTGFTLLTSSTVTLGTAGEESWYVVNGNVNITYATSGALKLNGAVHLILMDGATLTVEGQYPISASGSLTIYGQSLGTGRLVATGSGPAIKVQNSNTAIVNDCTLTINGGNINVTSDDTAIDVYDDITINGGSVTASSTYVCGDGITSVHGDITINGGTVNAAGGDRGTGILTEGTLTLGWRNATDRITASSFYSRSDNIVVKSGQVLSDGTAAYAGTLTTEQMNALKTAKTLQPCFSLTLPEHVEASGTGVFNLSSCYAIAGATVTLTPTGYLLGSASYNDGTAHDVAGNTFTMPAADVTVSASLTPITYSVHFDANGGTGEMADQSFTYDAAQNLTANAFTPLLLGYMFGRWTTNADGTGDSYTNAENVSNLTAVDGATVTLYAQWVIGDWLVENEGTEGDPYMIYFREQLDLLATRVNSGNTFRDKYFKLGADIIYPHKEADEEGADIEDNFTAIGGYGHSFQGVFDGDGHTISGIRIYKPDAEYQGLFGYVNGGTVKKVTLTDARITGKSSVAGIAGYTDSSTTEIEDCLILNAAITANNMYGGVLVGYKVRGTFSNNFYHDCIVKVGRNTYTTNVGLGAPQNDFAGEVICIHTLTLPTAVTASGETVVIDGVTYYTNQTPITLTYSDPVPDGKTVVFIGTCSNGDVIQTFNTFEMPGADVTVSVVMSEAYSLTLPDNISATGMTTTIGGTEYFLSGTIVTLGYTPVDGGFTLNRYIVNGTAIDGNTFTMPAADVAVSATTIDVWGIADGADGSEAHPYIITTAAGLDLLATIVNSGINEYGGKYFKLGADIDYQPTTAWDDATSTEDNYTAIGNEGKAFCGTFDGDGHTVSGIRIYKPGEDYQGLFGRVFAGVVKNVTVTDARITGYYYVGGISGQINGGTIIQDCLVLNSAFNGYLDCGAITGKTYNGCHLSNNYYHNCSRTDISDGTTRTTGIGRDYSDVRTNDGAVYTNGIPLLNNCSNDYVFTTYNGMANQDYTLAGRTLYKDGDWNTLCLPFDLILSGSVLNGAEARSLENATLSNGTLTLNFSTPVDELTAGTPYIIKWASDDDLVNPTFESVTISDDNNDFASGNVTFKGTYSPVTFDAGDKSVLFMGGGSNLYWPETAITVNAFRAYFQLNFDGSSSIKEFKLNFGEEDDPDGIRPPSISPEGERTEASPRGGLVGAAWYDLSGRKLNAKPTQKGLYIYGGKKVMMK